MESESDVRCYYAGEPPEIEVRDGLVFIMPVGATCKIALTPHTMAEFIQRASEALAVWQYERLGTVVPIH